MAAVVDEKAGLLPSDDEDDEMNELDDYELERQANIRNRDLILAELGLSNPAARNISGQPKKLALSSEETRRKRDLKAKDAALKRIIEPTRRSGRLAAKDNEPKREDNGTPSSPTPARRSSPSKPLIPKATARNIPSGPSYSPTTGPMSSAPRPTRADDGRLIFEGRWHDIFTPNITPEEMFNGGAFGGSFYADTYSHVMRAPLTATEDVEQLPFTVKDADLKLCNDLPDGSHNRFRVRAGQSLQEWEKAGWIWGGDPRGWAQWYTRFWDGRRCEDDERQVRRWLKVAGPTGRFKRALLRKLVQSGGKSALADEDVAAVLRQCLWQWGYELTESEFDRAMAGE
ncbi:hypothetical protein IAU60_005506 [Kwoniella sp. DSM 27419]